MRDKMLAAGRNPRHWCFPSLVLNIKKHFDTRDYFLSKYTPQRLSREKTSLRLKNTQNQDLSADDVGFGMVQTE